MRNLAPALKLLLLVTLILNGTAAHGMPMPAASAAESSYAKTGLPSCHSAADHDGSAPAAPQDSDATSDGGDPAEHDCGGMGCTCACVHQTPPFALLSGALGLPPGTRSKVAAPRVGIHSLTPLPLLRPPIA